MLCVISFHRKYACFVPLKEQKINKCNKGVRFLLSVINFWAKKVL